MAYSSVGTPRIYVNWLEWLYNTKGFTTPINYIRWRSDGTSLEFPFCQDSFLQKTIYTLIYGDHTNPERPDYAGGSRKGQFSIGFGLNTYNFINKLNFCMVTSHNLFDVEDNNQTTDVGTQTGPDQVGIPATSSLRFQLRAQNHYLDEDSASPTYGRWIREDLLDESGASLGIGSHLFPFGAGNPNTVGAVAHNGNIINNSWNYHGNQVEADESGAPLVITWNPPGEDKEQIELATRRDLVAFIKVPQHGGETTDDYFSNLDTQDANVKIGSIMCGRYFDFEHGSQMPSSLGISFEGVDTNTTAGGHTISNMRYSGKPINPFSYRAIENTISPKTNAEAGRKSWNLNFQFMSSEKILPTNFNDIAEVLADDYLSEYHEENFFSAVLNKTMGSHIPFVFQPDNTDFKDMHICRFDQNNFEFKEIAPGIYDMSLKIVETW